MPLLGAKKRRTIFRDIRRGRLAPTEQKCQAKGASQEESGGVTTPARLSPEPTSAQRKASCLPS